MSRNKKTKAWSQSKMPKRSFNFKTEYDDLFIEIRNTLEMLNGGEPLNNTQVMEWSLRVAAQRLADEEAKAMKQYRMQKAAQ